jgi:hypothetical protein
MLANWPWVVATILIWILCSVAAALPFVIVGG